MKALARLAGAPALLAVLAALPLLDAGTGGVLPGVVSSPGALQVLALMLVFAALAVTYDLLFGFTGLLSFGHGLFFALGVYVTDIVMTAGHLPLLAAAGIAVVAGILVPLVVGAVSLRVQGIAFAMVTLAFAQAASIAVGQNLFGITGGDLGLGLPYDRLPAGLSGVLNTKHLYWLALLLLVVVYAAAWWLTRSAPGRVWQAIRENEQRVEVLGINPYPFKLLSFVLASLLACLCGIVYLLLVTGAQPQVTSPDFTLTLLVMVVLGGTGRLWGAALGGALYTYLDQRLGDWAQSSAVQGLPAVVRVPFSQPLFVLGLLFVLFILFLPGGLSGLLTRLPRRAPFGVALSPMSRATNDVAEQQETGAPERVGSVGGSNP
jgi:branched-chain amino acid transport system permease protein